MPEQKHGSIKTLDDQFLKPASYPYFVRNSTATEPAPNDETTERVRTWHGDTTTKKPSCYKDLREIFIESALNVVFSTPDNQSMAAGDMRGKHGALSFGDGLKQLDSCSRTSSDLGIGTEYSDCDVHPSFLTNSLTRYKFSYRQREPPCSQSSVDTTLTDSSSDSDYEDCTATDRTYELGSDEDTGSIYSDELFKYLPGAEQLPEVVEEDYLVPIPQVLQINTTKKKSSSLSRIFKPSSLSNQNSSVSLHRHPDVNVNQRQCSSLKLPSTKTRTFIDVFSITTTSVSIKPSLTKPVPDTCQEPIPADITIDEGDISISPCTTVATFTEDLRQHNDNQEIITPSINHDDYTRANIRRVKKRNAKRRKRLQNLSLLRSEGQAHDNLGYDRHENFRSRSKETCIDIEVHRVPCGDGIQPAEDVYETIGEIDVQLERVRPDQGGCSSTPTHDLVEQMEMEDPPWAKEQQRRMRKRRKIKILTISGVVTLLLMIMGVSGLVIKRHIDEKLAMSANNTIQNSSTGSSLGVFSSTSYDFTTTAYIAETTTALQNQTIYLEYMGSTRVTNLQYTPDLANLSSSRAQAISEPFCDQVEAALTDQQNLDRCEIYSFRNGSVIIDFELIFRYDKPVRQMNESSTSPTTETLTPEQNTEITEKLNIFLEQHNNTLLLDNVTATLEDVIATVATDNYTETTTTYIQTSTLPPTTQSYINTTTTTATTITTTTTVNEELSLNMTTATVPTIFNQTNNASQTVPDSSTTSSIIENVENSTYTENTTPTVDEPTTFSVYDLPTHGSRFRTTSALLPATIFNLPSFASTAASESTTFTERTTATITLETLSSPENSASEGSTTAATASSTIESELEISNHTEPHEQLTLLTIHNLTTTEVAETTSGSVDPSNDNQTSNAANATIPTPQSTPRTDATMNITSSPDAPFTFPISTPSHWLSTIDMTPPSSASTIDTSIISSTTASPPSSNITEPATTSVVEPESSTEEEGFTADTTLASTVTTTPGRGLILTTDIRPMTAIVDLITSEAVDLWTTPDDSDEIESTTEPESAEIDKTTSVPSTTTITTLNVSQSNTQIHTASTPPLYPLTPPVTDPTTMPAALVTNPFNPPSGKLTPKPNPYTIAPSLTSTPGNGARKLTTIENSAEIEIGIPTKTTHATTSTANLNESSSPPTLSFPSTDAMPVSYNVGTVTTSPIQHTTVATTITEHIRSTTPPLLVTDRPVTVMSLTTTEYSETAANPSQISTATVPDLQCQVLGYSRADCRQLVLACPGDTRRLTQVCPQGLAYSVPNFVVQGDISACSEREKIEVHSLATSTCRPRYRAAYLSVYCNPYNGSGPGDLHMHRAQRCCGRYEVFHAQSQRCQRVARPSHTHTPLDEDASREVVPSGPSKEELHELISQEVYDNVTVAATDAVLQDASLRVTEAVPEEILENVTEGISQEVLGDVTEEPVSQEVSDNVTEEAASHNVTEPASEEMLENVTESGEASQDVSPSA